MLKDVEKVCRKAMKLIDDMEERLDIANEKYIGELKMHIETLHCYNMLKKKMGHANVIYILTTVIWTAAFLLLLAQI